jgi:hypothetical protein
LIDVGILLGLLGVGVFVSLLLEERLWTTSTYCLTRRRLSFLASGAGPIPTRPTPIVHAHVGTPVRRRQIGA